MSVCEFFDCGYCYDKSGNANCSINGECNGSDKCRVASDFISVDIRHPIIYCPEFSDEARAKNAAITINGIVDGIVQQLVSKKLLQPVTVTGARSEAVVRMLKERGVEAKHVRSTYIRGYEGCTCGL